MRPCFVSFFSESDERIRQWFDHFGPPFKRGAKALYNFCVQQRDNVWKDIKWEGAGASPIVCVHQPLRFADVDVVATVRSFLDSEALWSSEPFRTSLESGEFLTLDLEFFSQKLMGMLDSQEVLRSVESFVAGSEFAVLCRGLFCTLGDAHALDFIAQLRPCCRDLKLSVEAALLLGSVHEDLDCLLVYSMLATNPAMVLRLLKEDEACDSAAQLDSILALHGGFFSAAGVLGHWSLRAHLRAKASLVASSRFVLLECFLLRFATRSYTKSDFEQLMRAEGVPFERVFEDSSYCSPSQRKRTRRRGRGGLSRRKAKRPKNRRTSGNSSSDDSTSSSGSGSSSSSSNSSSDSNSSSSGGSTSSSDSEGDHQAAERGGGSGEQKEPVFVGWKVTNPVENVKGDLTLRTEDLPAVLCAFSLAAMLEWLMTEADLRACGGHKKRSDRDRY
eukprot:gnl/Hemi2/16932_TR5624_c0_g1_i1.p2 gnl/Hemi2/16932_TR5624_c0_g1~~gnl/Hemi2/16932_TR5624_c0_g1_i1.p2  ORF type:complete len:446 (-),score=88.91 gnl/Hemi2/16932_TR5624_c0_g1_i1:32-1369(-)